MEAILVIIIISKIPVLSCIELVSGAEIERKKINFDIRFFLRRKILLNPEINFIKLVRVIHPSHKLCRLRFLENLFVHYVLAEGFLIIYLNKGDATNLKIPKAVKVSKCLSLKVGV